MIFRSLGDMTTNFKQVGRLNSEEQRRKLIESCNFKDEDSGDDSGKEISEDIRLRKAQKVAIKKKIMENILVDCKELCKLQNEELAKRILQEVQSKRGEIGQLVAAQYLKSKNVVGERREASKKMIKETIVMLDDSIQNRRTNKEASKLS